jgi:hypothetical protein
MATLPTESDIVASPQSPPAASETNAPEIPDEVLEIPTMFGLLNGAPPAVWAETGRKDPEIAVIVRNVKPLEEAGLGFYKSKDGKVTAMYNSAFVSQDTLRKADEAGTLTTDIPKYDEVKQNADAAITGAAPGAALPGVPAVTQAAGSPPSSATQKSLAVKRANNLQVGSPTSGPVPGSGRILNNILRPVV